MLFTLTYLFSLLGPGLLITHLLRIHQQIVLLSLSFSLFYFVSVLVISIFFGLSINQFFILYGAGFIGLLLLLRFSRAAALTFDPAQLYGFIIVLIVSYLYMRVVGIYDELPSDVFRHLEFFKQISSQLQTHQFNPASGADLFNRNNYYWYYLPTLITYFSQTDFLNHLETYTLINVMVLLACIYEFTHWLFRDRVSQKLHLIITALLSSLFFTLHFGINVFAYVRYYAVAPTVLNFSIYLSSIVCLMSYYQGRLGFVKFCLIISALFLTAYLLHAQESLFIGIIFCIVTAILFINNLHGRFKQTHFNGQKAYRDSVLLIFPAMVIAITVVYLYVTNHLELTQIHSSKVITLDKMIGVGDDYLILNPYKQFYTVLTHWGLFIVLIYVILYRRFFTDQPVILAGMLAPLFTVFNPYFNEIFLRITSADVLWRFLYMLPLYIVAARIVTGLCFTSYRSKLKMTMNYFLVSMVFVLLLPINTPAISMPYSRIYSLSEVHDQARPAYWQDMLNFLQTLPDEEIIITDPVTGYMITALTKHLNRRYKFYTHLMKHPYEFDDYSSHPLSRYSGNIFVLNQRQGLSTATARIAKHWNPKNLKLKEFYSQTLIDHINAEPEHFRLIWQSDQIKIYRIMY